MEKIKKGLRLKFIILIVVFMFSFENLSYAILTNTNVLNNLIV